MLRTMDEQSLGEDRDSGPARAAAVLPASAAPRRFRALYATGARRATATLLAVAALLAAGCAGRMEPRFDQSNQMLMERAIGQLDLGRQVADILPPGAMVGLVSLERAETTDHPILALIEDGLVRSLVAAGFRVMERDDDLLRRMVAELPGGHLRLTYLPTDVEIASAAAAGTVASSGPYVGAQLTGGAGFTHIAGAGRDTIMVFETHLAPAAYLVAYRVLECGVVYREGSERGAKGREALVRLHARVHDTASGQILHADNLSGFLEDQVDANLLDALEDYRYSFFAHDLPLTRGSSQGGAPRDLRSQERQPSRALAALAAMMIVLGVAAAAW